MHLQPIGDEAVRGALVGRDTGSAGGGGGWAGRAGMLRQIASVVTRSRRNGAMH